MPIYSLKNKDTGEIFEKMMKISDYEQYLKDNPSIERYFESAPAFGDSVRLGIKKPPSDFMKNIVGNIYKGRVVNIEPSIQAAFVDFGVGRTATQIAVGGHHSCALLDNYDVKCWGQNTWGALGDTTTTDRATPRNAAAAWAATHPECRRNALEAVLTAYLDGRDQAEVFAAYQHDSTTEGKEDLLLQIDTEIVTQAAWHNSGK